LPTTRQLKVAMREGGSSIPKRTQSILYELLAEAERRANIEGGLIAN